MISQYLTPMERASCIKVGAYRRFVEAGVRPSRIDAMVKSGAWSDLPSMTMKTVMAVSLLTGIPIGIAAHIVGQRISGSRGRERELEQQAGFYRNASQSLASGLSQ